MDNPSLNQNGIEYNGEQIAYKDSTYELVSKVAYLIGVPLRIFQNEHEPPKIEIYDRLEQDKNARIIRNLCIIRTAIERNYRKINDIMRMEYRGLLSMPEILPMSSMQQLSNDGISFIKKSSTKLCHHIIEINRLISDRINNCKSLFPIWINWAYIKELYEKPDSILVRSHSLTNISNVTIQIVADAQQNREGHFFPLIQFRPCSGCKVKLLTESGLLYVTF